MPLESSKETVAILYDIENAPFEMLNFTLSKARRYKNCRTIVVSDWDERPEQKRWDKLLRRPGFTFRQISRTYEGKNSLDSAIYDSAKILYQEGVRKFFIITTDSDFVKIAKLLNSDTPSYIIGVGTKQASETLRNAYNEFFVYPPEEKKVKHKESKKAEKAEKEQLLQESREAVEEDAVKKDKQEEKAAKKQKKAQKKARKVKTLVEEIAKQAAEQKAAKAQAAPVAVKEAKAEPAPRKTSRRDDAIMLNLPKSLRAQLAKRQQEEGVTMNELLTYLITRGLAQ